MSPLALQLVAAGHRLEAVWYGARGGDGPVLVLLHEGLGSVSAWRDWPAALARETGLPILAYSRWGYGRSDEVAVPRPLTYMHDEASSLGEVLEAAGARRAILVGHSDGGSIALIHAGRDDARGRVAGLVLLAPHVFCEQVSVDSIARAREAFESGDLRARLARHHADVDGAFWGWNRAWLDPEFRRWNLEEFLPGVRVPTLVVQGEDDPYGTVAQVEAIGRGVRGRFEQRLLPRCGHAPHRDAPQATTAEVVRFVRSIAANG